MPDARAGRFYVMTHDSCSCIMIMMTRDGYTFK